jgi:hypothetical protein
VSYHQNVVDGANVHFVRNGHQSDICPDFPNSGRALNFGKKTWSSNAAAFWRHKYFAYASHCNRTAPFEADNIVDVKSLVIAAMQQHS